MDASQYTKEQLPELRNIPVYGADGDEIGHVGDAYYDEQTGRLECVGVKGDALGFTRRMVPVAGATVDERGMHLAYGATDLQGAPDYGDDDLDDDRYREVSDYYGRVGADQAVTRSEEELRVGKEEAVAGRVRLRKWVETEPVEADVELRRETARVTREPVNEVVSDAEIGEEQVEVQLQAERPVVSKETVARERIGIETEQRAERETIRDEVRREHIDVEGDGDVADDVR